MASELGWDDWPGFSPAATEALVGYAWPGNVRELRNVVGRAVYRWERQGPIDEIQFDPFQSPYAPASPPRPPAPSAPMSTLTAEADPHPEAPLAACDDDGPSDFKSQVARFEHDLLAKAMADHRYNQRATAEALGLSYDQLRHALRRHDLLPG
jgi:psp operon transcriptional activator